MMAKNWNSLSACSLAFGTGVISQHAYTIYADIFWDYMVICRHIDADALPM